MSFLLLSILVSLYAFAPHISHANITSQLSIKGEGSVRKIVSFSSNLNCPNVVIGFESREQRGVYEPPHSSLLPSKDLCHSNSRNSKHKLLSSRGSSPSQISNSQNPKQKLLSSRGSSPSQISQLRDKGVYTHIQTKLYPEMMF